MAEPPEMPSREELLGRPQRRWEPRKRNTTISRLWAVVCLGGAVAIIGALVASNTTKSVVRQATHTTTAQAATPPAPPTATSPATTASSTTTAVAKAPPKPKVAGQPITFPGALALTAPSGWKTSTRAYPGRDRILLSGPGHQHVAVDYTASVAASQQAISKRPGAHATPYAGGQMWAFTGKKCHPTCADYLINLRGHAAAVLASTPSEYAAAQQVAASVQPPK